MATISSAGKKIGRPAVGAVAVNVRLAPDQLAKLDAWIAHQPVPQLSRPEAVRRILEARLVHEEERGRL